MRSNSISDWFVRSIFRLSAVVTSLVAICILIIRAVNPYPVCLNLENHLTNVLDPNSGQIFEIFQPTPIPSASNSNVNYAEPLLAYIYSPNGVYIAKFDHLGRDGLRVEKFNIPPLTNTRRDMLSDPFLSEIQWSPDEKWIAYRWKEQDGTQYLALADQNGKERNLIKLDTLPGEDIQLDSWSADAQYLTIINKALERYTGRMRFLSMPDLKFIDLVKDTEKVGRGCEGPQSVDARLHCQPWGPSGHLAAYITDKGETAADLIIINPGESAPQVIPLPAAGQSTVRISPDNSLVAVASFGWDDDITLLSEAELYLYSTDGKFQTKIGNIAFDGLGGAEGTPRAEMVWSKDFLIYARHDPETREKIQILAYYPSLKENRLLLPDLKNEEYNFQVSPDGQFAAIFTPFIYSEHNNLYFISLDGKINRHLSSDLPMFPQVHWSPDSRFLAYPTENNQNNSTIFLVNRDGNEVGKPLTLWHADTLTWTPCSMIP
jgi:hypothetical protein